MIRPRSGQQRVRSGIQQKDTLSSVNKGGRAKMRVEKCAKTRPCRALASGREFGLYSECSEKPRGE